MKKIIRLTENDLVRLVKKVIKEQKLGGESQGSDTKINDCDTNQVVVADSVNNITIEVDSNIKLPIIGKLQAPSQTNSAKNGVIIGIRDTSEKLSSFLRNVLGALSLQRMKPNITKDNNTLESDELNTVMTPLAKIRDGFINKYSSHFQGGTPTGDEIERFIEAIINSFTPQALNTLIKNVQTLKRELDTYVTTQGKSGYKVKLPNVLNSSSTLDKVNFNEKIYVKAWIGLRGSGNTGITDKWRPILYKNICDALNQYITSGNLRDNGVITIPSIQYLATINSSLADNLRKMANPNGTFTGSIDGIFNQFTIRYERILISIETISPNRIGNPELIELS
jgi:hypothetical protein